MERAKKRSWPIVLSYRIKRVSQKVIGRRRLLRFCLNASWLLRRFAFELSCDIFGNTFQESALALSERVLQQSVPAGGSVLDIGCGTGRWCRVAARHAGYVVGIDQNRASIQTARSLSTEPNLEYVTGDVTRDLAGRSFDVGLLIHTLEHIEDAGAFLRSLRSIVKTLIVEVPDFEAESLNVVRVELNCPYYSDADHVAEYSLGGLRGQLESSGWRVKHHEQRGGAILAVAVLDDEEDHRADQSQFRFPN
jgi:SAM-dependent methyltransferase